MGIGNRQLDHFSKTKKAEIFLSIAPNNSLISFNQRYTIDKLNKINPVKIPQAAEMTLMQLRINIRFLLP